jgi:hypothetical protein
MFYISLGPHAVGNQTLEAVWLTPKQSGHTYSGAGLSPVLISQLPP